MKNENPRYQWRWYWHLWCPNRDIVRSRYRWEVVNCNCQQVGRHWHLCLAFVTMFQLKIATFLVTLLSEQPLNLKPLWLKTSIGGGIKQSCWLQLQCSIALVVNWEKLPKSERKIEKWQKPWRQSFLVDCNENTQAINLQTLKTLKRKCQKPWRQSCPGSKGRPPNQEARPLDQVCWNQFDDDYDQ